MEKYLLILLPTLLFSVSCASAGPVSWLDGGNVMHAKTNDSASEQRGAADKSPLTVILATGQEVVLTGGVYVKAKDTSVVLAWAMANNYVALESPYITGAIDVQTTPEESIEVANMIAALEGVTTSAPKYRKPVVAK